MRYRNLGRSGLKVSELGYGSWLTFGETLDLAGASKCMRAAFDAGINFFDNAEVYAWGESEIIMGKALSDFRREDLVVSTKLFWGGRGPNDLGLSWKHLMEGTKNSLKRLNLEYVDILFCHRPDPTTPIEETVRAMDAIIRMGYVLYWGTSEWSRENLEDAYEMALKYNCIPPSAEQPEYNMFVRDRFEREYSSLFKKYGLGATIWSPLASGALTGKYLDSKLQPNAKREKWLTPHLTPEKLIKIRQLQGISSELGGTLAQLSLAWCLKNPNVSTVITGANSVEQLRENMQASDTAALLSNEYMNRIERILNSGTCPSNVS